MDKQRKVKPDIRERLKEMVAEDLAEAAANEAAEATDVSFAPGRKVVVPVEAPEVTKGTTAKPPAKKRLRETKAVGYTVESPVRVEEVITARDPVSAVLHIRFLVRPYTLNLLREMLSRYGTVEDVWTDRIKSKAYVQFSDSAMATECREALDGCRWPNGSPKILRADFSCLAEIAWMKENGDSGKPIPKDLWAPKSVTTNEAATMKPPPSSSQIKEKKETDRKVEGEDRRKAHEVTRKRSTERDRDRSAHDNNGDGRTRTTSETKKSAQQSGGVREWDRHKLRQSESPKRASGDHDRRPAKESISTKEERKESRPTTEELEPQRKKKKEEPVKHLDDLFRKTKAVPAIYWLPLTAEQAKARITEQETQRKERQVERQKAIESRRSPQLKQSRNRRSPSPRRRRSPSPPPRKRSPSPPHRRR